MNDNPIQHVPTNVITGFLGVGKTTLIQQLLQHKPENERWAILVNEFGEVGIDGALFNAPKKQGLFMREVPGGCMCCTSGLPMQIALNQLLAKARPHRLLIEPTGLGHPAEVLQSLTAPHYQEVLDLQKTLCLVDARKLADPRWREHPTFQEQLQIADLVVATKQDLYQGDEKQQLKQFLVSLALADTPVVDAEQCTELSVLAGASGFITGHGHHHAHSKQVDTPDIPALLEQNGKVRIDNKGQGFYSCGWVYPASKWFDYDRVFSVLSGIDVERLKAVFITEKGIFAFNLSEGILQCIELDESDDSRLTFIVDDKDVAEQLAESLESAIFEG